MAAVGCDVHDIVDEIDVAAHIDEAESAGSKRGDPDDDWPIAMTTWHAEETVEEALRDFVTCRIRDERKPGGRLVLIALDETVDAAPVLAWLDRWEMPAHRLTGGDPAVR